jgi:plastocyanin
MIVTEAHMRIALILITLVLTTPLLAKDVWLSITGKANGFFTDARVFNPSFTKDITIQAKYLPTGNVDNNGVQPVTLTIPKRTMKVYDDAVQSMFGGGPALGAILLSSQDDFVASQRIYQDARTGPQAGTLGQFVPGLEPGQAKTKGALLQLKSGPSAIGTFRTNWGGVNPTNTTNVVTMTLYDKNNAVVGTKEVTFQPFGAIAPSNIVGTFDNTTADLADAWISFTAEHPVFLYGSVVDNGSVDPTFIPASDDSGVPPEPPQPKVVTIHAEDGFFNVNGADDLHVGDEVTFIVTGEGGTHGIRMFTPSGGTLFTIDPLGAAQSQKTVTITAAGIHEYVCTRPTCSSGHISMSGAITVQAHDDGEPGGGYPN